MQKFLKSLAFTCALSLAVQSFAADPVAPVRMGAGAMTFDTVPGWGLGEDGKSVIGPTHGSVVIDKAGNIYTSADMGVFVFSPDGKLIRRFVGDEYTKIHDMEIRDEAEGEFIYGARNANAEGIKFSAETGDIVLKLPFPKESKLDLKQFNPTAITVACCITNLTATCMFRTRTSQVSPLIECSRHAPPRRGVQEGPWLKKPRWPLERHSSTKCVIGIWQWHHDVRAKCSSRRSATASAPVKAIVQEGGSPFRANVISPETKETALP